MNWKYSIEDTARSLGLKKSGSQYSGPCPCCGGRDRFWIKRGKQHDIIATCRQGCDFSVLAKELKALGMIEDSPFYTTRYRQDDITKAHTLMMIAENMAASGHQFSDDDVLAVSSLIGVVPDDVKDGLRHTLNIMRQP